jgi:hypothetical protein
MLSRSLPNWPQVARSDPGSARSELASSADNDLLPSLRRLWIRVLRPTQATLGAATRVRSEPLKTSTHHNAGEVFHGAYCRTLLLIEDGVFEVVPGICPVLGLGHFGKRRLGREVQATSGGASDLHKPDVPTRGTPKGYESGDASSASPLTTRTCPESLWRKNDIRRTSRIAPGNSPGGTP